MNDNSVASETSTAKNAVVTTAIVTAAYFASRVVLQKLEDRRIARNTNKD